MAVVCPALVYTWLDTKAFHRLLLCGILTSTLLSFILPCVIIDVLLLLMMPLSALSFQKEQSKARQH